MKPGLYLCVAAISVCLISPAQETDLRVHFPKGSARIEKESLQALKNWASNNSTLSTEKVLLRGHTDSDAGDDYNMRLSIRRNNSVKRVLSDFGFNRIEFTSHGETWPVCNSTDENCMHENRRVDVVLLNTDEEKFAESMYETSPQTFFVNGGQATECRTSGGSTIYLPQLGFVHANGTPATEYRIEAYEFLTKESWIENGLTTMCGDKIIRSGGMMHIDAYYQNEKLELAEGESVGILFASQAANPDLEMQAFNGWVRMGKLDWFLSDPGEGSVVEGRFSNRYLQKDGTYKQMFRIGGRDINVSYGKTTPVIAEYVGVGPDARSLTDSERSSIIQAMDDKKFGQGVLNFQNMGWANCDAFARYPVLNKEYISFNEKDINTTKFESPRFYLILKTANVLLEATVREDGWIIFPTVPSGQDAVLLAWGKGEEKSFFAIKELMTGGNPMINIHLSEMDNDDVKNKIGSVGLAI